MSAAALSSRSEAARRANETRRFATAVNDLRAFASFHKNGIRETVADFLLPYGGLIGDLHGADGASARLFASRGADVVSAEDGRYLVKLTGLPESALRGALALMAKQGGYELYWGDFTDVLPSCRTAFYDPCGPYLAPTSRVVRAMAHAKLKAFALTVELSRVDGGRGKGPGHYLRWAEVGLHEDAPYYRVEQSIEYQGVASIPMAVFLVSRSPLADRFEDPEGYALREAARERERADREARLAVMRAEWRAKEQARQRVSLALAPMVRAFIDARGGVVPFAAIRSFIAASDFGDAYLAPSTKGHLELRLATRAHIHYLLMQGPHPLWCVLDPCAVPAGRGHDGPKFWSDSGAVAYVHLENSKPEPVA